jgi:hypothetical protein
MQYTTVLALVLNDYYQLGCPAGEELRSALSMRDVRPIRQSAPPLGGGQRAGVPMNALGRLGIVRP